MLNTSSHIDEKTCCNKNTEVRELTSDNELNTTQLDSMNCILPLDLEQEKDEDHHGYGMLEDFDDNLVDISELFENSELQKILCSAEPRDTVAIGRQPRKGEGVYVEGTIQGVNGIFTIDTGAARTVISETVYNTIPATKRSLLTKSSSLIGADGRPLVELGTAEFSIQLGTVSFEKELVVAQIDDEVLLGLDILMMGDRGPTELKLVDKLFTWNGENIPCKVVKDLRRIRNVNVADDFTVPALSEVVLDVYVEIDQIDGLCSALEFLIEPSPCFMEKSPLVMAASLVDLLKNVTGKVRMLNRLNNDIVLHQGTIIGTAVLYTGTIYPVLSEEDETEIENLNTLRRLQFDKNDCKTQMNKHSESEKVVADVQRKRPVSKPNISETHVKDTDVPNHLREIYVKAREGRPEEERRKIASLLNRFEHVFSKDDDDLGTTHLLEHTINTGSSKPLKQPPRRVPLAFANEEKLVIEQMERQGIIRKSKSPWASPIVLVRKKNGKVRPCIDYRRLNSVTENDAFPLPRIQDCLDAVSGSTLYSTMDLTSGYHQVPVMKSDIPKTAFVTKYGLYEFLKMPMGLKSAPMTFQRVMELALQGLQ